MNELSGGGRKSPRGRKKSPKKVTIEDIKDRIIQESEDKGIQSLANKILKSNKKKKIKAGSGRKDGQIVIPLWKENLAYVFAKSAINSIFDFANGVQSRGLSESTIGSVKDKKTKSKSSSIKIDPSLEKIKKNKDLGILGPIIVQNSLRAATNMSYHYQKKKKETDKQWEKRLISIALSSSASGIGYSIWCSNLSSGEIIGTVKDLQKEVRK
jgi:lipid II:glycine glycyltransferase (peptidoglycan interpeptide bridge formation enzyme)